MASMAYNSAAGLRGMLQAGSRHYSQQDDLGAGSVVLHNIDACLQLSRMVSTSLGPQGRCKLVVNHLGKISVTSDCASILKEIEIEHPAAQLLATASKKQEEEFGDNTNFVLAFGGELLFETAKLISKMTWQPAPEILAGYQHALDLCDDYLPKLCIEDDGPRDLSNMTHLLKVLKPVLASKQYGSEEFLAPLVAEACLHVMQKVNGSKNVKVPVDAVRTVKILGSSVSQSTLLSGYVAKAGLETTNKIAKNAKIVVFACGFEASSTEAKSTVLMKNADDLLNYNKTEEAKMHEIVQGIKESGVTVVVTGGTLSDMALHFLDKYEILCLKVGSKWELRRLCQAVGATALVRLGAPTPDEMGHAQTVEQHEIGGKTVTVFTNSESKIATLVLRASTNTVLNDLERAVDDGVHALANACKDPRLVYGGGAVEMALSHKLQEVAASTPGLEQYSIMAFAQALLVIPKTLAENAGWESPNVLADLLSAHVQGQTHAGVDIESMGTTASMKDKNIVDLLVTKQSALRLAVDAVITILKIDQIIMSKPAGGPRPSG